jgi:hypothetical protein
VLLSVFTWTGTDAASSTKWSDGGNWDRGSAPGIGDTVVFDANNPAGTPNVSTVDKLFPIANLTVKAPWSGTIEVLNALTLTAGFSLASGDIEVDNTMLVSGTSTWTGGTIDGGATLTNSGTLTIDPGASSGVVFGATGAATTPTWDNSGTTDLVSGFLSMEGHATLNNVGVFNILNDTNIFASFVSSLDYGIINNSGTFNKSSATLLGTGTSIINDLFNNTGGTINAELGFLALTHGGVSTGGTFNASARATLDLEGSPSAGTSYYAGGYSGTGAGSVLWSNTLNLAAAGASFDFAPGLLKWDASVTGGPLTNEGSMTAGSGAAIFSSALTNDGTIAVTASLNLGGGATLNNVADGTIDFQGDVGVTGFVGGGTVTNIGTVEKTMGTGTSSISVPFDNLSNSLVDGKIVVQTGTISLGAGGMSTGGTFTVAGGATLDLSGGSTAVLNGSYTGSGTGTVTFSGTLDVRAAGATVNFPPGLFHWRSGVIKGSGGLTNVGTLTIDTSSGTPILANGGVLSNSGTILLAGAGSWDLGFFGTAAATLNNLATGLVDVQGDASVATGDASGLDTFNNAGTFQKSAGSGSTSVGVAFNNTGTVLAHSGTLSFDASVAQLAGGTLTGGAWDVDSGSTLTFSVLGPVTTNAANVTLTGAGSTFSNLSGLASNTGTLDLEGGQTFMAAGNFTNSGSLIAGAASALDVTGNFTQTAAGTLTTKLADRPATGLFGKVVGAGPAALGGTLAVRGVAGFMIQASDAYKVITYASETGTPMLDDGGLSVAEQINPNDLTIVSAAPIAVATIAGPAGFGAAHFVSLAGELSYTIGFENAPAATAPAQTLVVTEQLDSNLDWSTFQLGDLAFGGTAVTVPPGSRHFSTVVDDRANSGLFVDVTAGIDASTGLVTWTFTSIDPSSMAPPTDPKVGFLPPDMIAPEGAGHVSYTVQPRAGLTTGTAIVARAAVTANTSAPVDSAAVANTVDAGAPSSHVQALPSLQDSPDIALSWTGADDNGGSGIASFDIDVSTDGGPFVPFLTAPSATSAVFHGSFGHSYGFFSVATDNVGNVQATPTVAQATTTVLMPASPSPQPATPSPTPTSTPVPTPTTTPTPPHATGIVGVTHSRRGLTAIAVAFDEALDPGSAVNLSLYSVLGAVKSHGKTVFSKGIAIRGVNYDSNAHTVTINLARPFKGAVQVTVRAGIAATNGTSSSGSFSAVTK